VDNKNKKIKEGVLSFDDYSKKGLGYSDYFNKSVPYDVKPTFPTMPTLEEDDSIPKPDDYPLRAKELYKGLWENTMTSENIDTFKLHLVQLFSYLKKELKLKTIPKVKLVSDQKNADKMLGKTAYYEPETKTVCLFITDRHPKDILRSFSHEIVHHWQHENEKLQSIEKSNKDIKELEGNEKDPEYAQHDPWLRQMEKQAYLLGNILFRDWEDQKKAKDRKSGKKMTELYKSGNVRCSSNTPSMKAHYSKDDAYRKNVEGPQDGVLKNDPNEIEEETYLIGKEYPPKKMNYKG